jgi:signal transduction histidine kinase
VESDLTQIRTTATEAVQAMDSIVWAINPQCNSLEHFAAYVSRYAEEFLRPAGVKFRFDTPADLPESVLGTEDRHQLFLAVREALTNVVKHAHAQKVRIRLECNAARFIVHVEDDGRGIPEGETAPGADGLHSMRSRMEAVGGGFVANKRDGGGTALRFTVPLDKPRKAAKETMRKQ